MADYLVSGKKGAGKSLFSVGVIRDALRAGKRVATNLDIHLDKLLPPHYRCHIIRIPDRPTVDDMLAIGRGQEGVVEDDNGIIVLDECSSFFNSRTYNDKSRQPLLDWFIHSRKYGWDTYFIAQGQEQLDKQLRTTQIEYHISVTRTDKWPIPLVTPAFKALGINLRFPRMHVGVVRHGMDSRALLIERRWYRGDDLYPCYDTQQVFLDRGHPEACGLHTVLSPYHTKGRYLGWFAMNKPVLVFGLLVGLLLGVPGGGYGAWIVWGKPRPSSGLAQVETGVRAVGFMHDGKALQVQLSDGRVAFASESRNDAQGRRVKVGGKWYLVDL